MLVENILDGVEKNIAPAESLYEYAIDYGKNFSAMNNLAMHLQTYQDGVGKDVACDVSLYERANDKGF